MAKDDMEYPDPINFPPTYLWTYTIVDPDCSDEIDHNFPCWLVWENLHDLRLFAQTSLINHFKCCCVEGEVLSEEQIVHVYDQMIEFCEDIKPAQENMCDVFLYDFHNKSDEKTLEVRIWSMTLQKTREPT